MIFTAFFCRTTFPLFQVPLQLWRNLFSIRCHIGKQLLQYSWALLCFYSAEAFLPHNTLLSFGKALFAFLLHDRISLSYFPSFVTVVNVGNGFILTYSICSSHLGLSTLASFHTHRLSINTNKVKCFYDLSISFLNFICDLYWVKSFISIYA